MFLYGLDFLGGAVTGMLLLALYDHYKTGSTTDDIVTELQVLRSKVETLVRKPKIIKIEKTDTNV